MIQKEANMDVISYAADIPENAKVIVIAMHGFAGDKESGCIHMLEECVVKQGMGLFRFDWPAHGASTARDDQLNVSRCLSDLDSVVSWIHIQYPGAKLAAFATSFGGYLTLLYMAQKPDLFAHVILRSPAIRMYEVFCNTILTAKMREDLQANHVIHVGFDRKMQLTNAFINDLRQHDAFGAFDGVMLKQVTIIHGSADDVVPVEDSIAFADAHHCIIHLIEGADHRYKKPGELQQVIAISIDVLSKLE